MPTAHQQNPRTVLLAAAIVFAAACGSVGGQVETPEIPGELSDPDFLARLGVPDPTIDWERGVDRLRYVGEGSAPLDSEVGLVRQVIDDMPTVLLAQLDVRWVVRATNTSLARPQHPTAVAYAVGPDIYLLDRAFTLSDGGSTRNDLARAVAHELAHVAQFQTLSSGYISAALAGGVSRINPTDGSSLVADFADATGWINTSVDPLRPQWSLGSGSTASSAYGATDPGEDMAEAVALMVVGLADLVPDVRVRWVESWLGINSDALALGQPWAPEGSIEVLSDDPLYDTQAVASLQGSLSHAEPLYFRLPRDVAPPDQLIDEIESQLRTRVMSGTLEPLGDERVPRYGGRFSRPDGTMWWIELWDFRDAATNTGLDSPILVYVAIW